MTKYKIFGKFIFLAIATYLSIVKLSKTFNPTEQPTPDTIIAFAHSNPDAREYHLDSQTFEKNDTVKKNGSEDDSETNPVLGTVDLNEDSNSECASEDEDLKNNSIYRFLKNRNYILELWKRTSQNSNNLQSSLSYNGRYSSKEQVSTSGIDEGQTSDFLNLSKEQLSTSDIDERRGSKSQDLINMQVSTSGIDEEQLSPSSSKEQVSASNLDERRVSKSQNLIRIQTSTSGSDDEQPLNFSILYSANRFSNSQNLNRKQASISGSDDERSSNSPKSSSSNEQISNSPTSSSSNEQISNSPKPSSSNEQILYVSTLNNDLEEQSNSPSSSNQPILDVSTLNIDLEEQSSFSTPNIDSEEQSNSSAYYLSQKRKSLSKHSLVSFTLDLPETPDKSTEEKNNKDLIDKLRNQNFHSLSKFFRIRDFNIATLNAPNNFNSLTKLNLTQLRTIVVAFDEKNKKINLQKKMAIIPHNSNDLWSELLHLCFEQSEIAKCIPIGFFISLRNYIAHLIGEKETINTEKKDSKLTVDVERNYCILSFIRGLKKCIKSLKKSSNTVARQSNNGSTLFIQKIEEETIEEHSLLLNFFEIGNLSLEDVKDFKNVTLAYMKAKQCETNKIASMTVPTVSKYSNYPNLQLLVYSHVCGCNKILSIISHQFYEVLENLLNNREKKLNQVVTDKQ